MKIVDNILQPAREQELAAQACISHISRLQRIIERLTSCEGSNREVMTETLDKLRKAEDQLNRHIDRLVDYRETALKYLEKLAGEEYAVIYRYYIKGENWQKIAAETFMSERRVYMLRSSALNILESLYEQEGNN